VVDKVEAVERLGLTIKSRKSMEGDPTLHGEEGLDVESEMICDGVFDKIEIM